MSTKPERTGTSFITRPLFAVRDVTASIAYYCEKLGELHRELEAAGAIIKTPPFEVVWNPGLSQLDVEDPDGNTLVFWGKPG